MYVLHCSGKTTVADVGLVTLASRISLVVSDLMVLGATWVKTIRTVHKARRLNMQVPLSKVLLRDGECYTGPSSVDNEVLTQQHP